MPLTSKQGAIGVADDTIRLPGEIPEFPSKEFGRTDYLAREKALRQWNGELKEWWESVRRRITDSIADNAGATNTIAASSSSIRKTVGELTVRVDEVSSGEITDQQAIARRIVSVSAIASRDQNIYVQTFPPSAPALNDIWVDVTDITTPISYYWNGTEWIEIEDILTIPGLAQERANRIASVNTEATARITADGYMEGKYTLSVVAGNVVTGMQITSASGPGFVISSVIFSANDFLIHNGTTGKQMFAISGSSVTLGGTFVVDTASERIYVGLGTYADAGTSFYLDSSGRFSLKDKLRWDGSTLTIDGVVNITGGNAARTDLSNVTVGYAGSPTAGGAANSIIGQGAFATLSAAVWSSQVTGKPVELTDGRIAAALDAAGLVITGVKPGINVTTGTAGLYLGADFLGYYNGSAWRTYMDNVGNFYLGGVGGALQWDGSTLNVIGNITVTGGNAAKADLSNVTTGYAGSTSVGGPANNIVGQGALATLNAVSWGGQISGRPLELTDGRIAAAINSAGVVVTGVNPGINVTTGGAGLYLGADFLGYYNGSAWRTYMDNTGQFFLGGVGGALQWNGSILSIIGSITVTGGNAAKTDFSNVSAGYAGSSSVAGAANSIVGQGSLATANSVNWFTQVGSRPTELTDGRISSAINSAGIVVSGVQPGINVTTGGAGLYLGANYMGYYNGGAWATYMDNSGQFFLGGTGGALRWNGSSLEIYGSGSFSGNLSAATGSFSGSITSSSGTIGGFNIGSTMLQAGSGTSQVRLDSAGIIGVGSTSGPQALIRTNGVSRPSFAILNASGDYLLNIFQETAFNGGFIAVSDNVGALGVAIAGANGGVVTTGIVNTNRISGNATADIRIGNHDVGTDGLELSTFRSGDGNCIIDFHSSVGSDYDLRLYRLSGANGDFVIQQMGSGRIDINASGGVYVNGNFIG